jgi:hypothetical protein
MLAHPTLRSEQVLTGMELEFVREPANPEDGSATMLRTQDGQQLGYVPRQYSQVVARALDAGRLVQATAMRWQNVPASPERLVVRSSRRRSSCESRTAANRSRPSPEARPSAV